MKTLRAAAVLLASISALVPIAASGADVGPTADTQALRQLIRDFEAARRANDKEAMSRLYTQDSSYFQRSGREALLPYSGPSHHACPPRRFSPFRFARSRADPEILRSGAALHLVSSGHAIYRRPWFARAG